MHQIITQKLVFDERLKIEEAEISSPAGVYKRMRLKRPDASAVLLFNTDTQKILLVKQFRYAISSKRPEKIIEIVAGVVDDGEDPPSTAVRECAEETGYRPLSSNLQHICSCFVSPGYTSECMHVYFAEVTNREKVGQGGGLAEEHEDVELFEITMGEFMNLCRKGAIHDAKTLIAGLWLTTNPKYAIR